MGSIVFREVQITSNGNRGEPCHNSRTKLHMKLLHVQKRDNIEFYLCCKFQRLPFSVRHKTDVTDGVTNKQTNKRTNYRMPRGSAPRHNNITRVLTRVNRCSTSKNIMSKIVSVYISPFTLYLHALSPRSGSISPW